MAQVSCELSIVCKVFAAAQVPISRCGRNFSLAFFGIRARIKSKPGLQNKIGCPGETMADQPVVQVSRLLDERGLSAFQIKLLVWSLFIVLIDGYDIAAIAFAAPHLARAWGVAPSALGPVFSASLVGILFGSVLFGWIGDRYGRKAALVGSNLLFG